MTVAAALLLLSTSTCLESRADEKLLSSRELAAAQGIILSQNCGTCHSLNDGDFELAGNIGPNLSQRRGTLRNSNWLRTKLTDPRAIPDHQVALGFQGKQHLMPPLQASEKELDLLVRYLQSLR